MDGFDRGEDERYLPTDTRHMLIRSYSHWERTAFENIKAAVTAYGLGVLTCPAWRVEHEIDTAKRMRPAREPMSLEAAILLCHKLNGLEVRAANARYWPVFDRQIFPVEISTDRPRLGPAA